MARISSIAALSAGLLAAVSPLTAQNVVADVDQIAGVLQNEGYQAKLIGEGQDRHVWL